MKPTVTVVGGGPAGLMAAEVLAGGGCAVTVYERMPTVGRKLLMAGRGGLNLTHSEPREAFLSRYGEARDWLTPMLGAFPPSALRAWCASLGEETFVGSSGRVFPKSFKASPLLRAWQRRLDSLGVRIETQHRWLGWADIRADASVLALGGASWPRLGSDASWVGILRQRGVVVSPLRPANCGFEVDWSDHLRERFAGQPLKRIALSFGEQRVRGEAMITAHGLEGGAVYALAATLREAILRDGRAVVNVDLLPDLDESDIGRRLSEPRGARSLSTILRRIGLSAAAVALLHENRFGATPAEIAARIKRAPVIVVAARPIERAISTAGGIARDEVDDALMLKRIPGVFVAGEMLDWEAPTGGYLLQATFATAVTAAHGALGYLGRPVPLPMGPW
ncbi:MAG: TIGR03862 family flavoprotein [Alphaproteobacteria bacterium]|nr:TIGR03862 family flavoprotein [Alphaproteobacteria bacterium]MCW5741492.1 TIGR03862 family flavoprotein [Alphaproteobacteria bacterium]